MRRSASGAGFKLLSVAYLLLYCFPRGLYLHTKLVLWAVAAVVMR